MKTLNNYFMSWAILGTMVICIACNPQQDIQEEVEPTVSDYPIRPVEFTKVKITDGFWKSRVDTATKVTIPYSFNKCEETGRVNNFVFAGGLKEGKFVGKYGFDDSDVYKIIEGASYSLMDNENPELKAYLDKLISYISAAQEDDGYLYTPWTLKANDYAEMHCCSYSEDGQFINSRWSHELYNSGHMYEAAVAHYRATGEKSFLDVATKNADLIYKICIEEGKKYYPGHQEIELGLVKLYRATGDKRYLELAKEFLERRGRGLTNYSNEGDYLHEYDIYSQDHLPVTEQSEAVGHSVRAGYMYAAMADIAAIERDTAYLEAIDRIWENIVGKKLYITGGLGAGNGIEGFDVAYALPNDAYAETCAAIANVYWNHRMFLLHGDSKYMDILERSLYNGLIVGLSMKGDEFFYPNPLEFDGERKFNQGAVCRSAWFDCSCCPSNLSRFVPSVSGYAYASTNKDVYVNLFLENESEIAVGDQIMKITQQTDYPWSGEVSLLIENEESIEANLKIRIPGWSVNEPVPSDLYTFTASPSEKTSILVNGEMYDFEMEKGYAVVKGEWNKGDKVEVSFPMDVKSIKSHENIVDNRGKLAYQRGPLLYCAEAIDNQGHALDLVIDDESETFTAEFKPDLLNGVTVLDGNGLANNKEIPVRLIPYYAWSHRDITPMTVWIKSSI